MSCGVGPRCGWDPALLWLWHRLAATAPIRALAWELPYAVGVALKKKKKHFISRCRSSHSVYEDMDSIPGPAQWVMDPV